MEFVGVLLGLFTVLSIGLGHVWVVKAEYYIGAYFWPVPLVGGAALIVASLWIDSVIASGASGIFGVTLIWGARELAEQGKRVERGLFPQNPKKRPHS